LLAEWACNGGLHPALNARKAELMSTILNYSFLVLRNVLKANDTASISYIGWIIWFGFHVL